MEKLSRVLSDFAVEPEKMTRVRGGFLLETGEGLHLLQEYRGGTAKLEAVEALQNSLREEGFFRTDLLLRTKKGNLTSRDVDGTVYVLKEWPAGQECSRENRSDLFAGAELLAELHALTARTKFAADVPGETERRPEISSIEEKRRPEASGIEEKRRPAAFGIEEKRLPEVTADAKAGDAAQVEIPPEERRIVRQQGIEAEDLSRVFEKRIRELRRARNFLKNRRQKTDYEAELYRHADYYISCGERAAERLRISNYGSLRQQAAANGTIVHGAYHYHNILILPAEAACPGNARTETETGAARALPKVRQPAGQKYHPAARPAAAAVNFERMAVGIQITDLYAYIRKILEKNAWNRDLGYRLIERYRRRQPISADEAEILRVLFLFPEKYWKLVNHYCNHSKSWLPGKNPEKLAALVRQEEARVRFAEGI